MQLTSKIDSSVNFITPCPSGDGGYFESRFVSREADQLICYLSSHSGCALACKMCHLTTTGQTMMTAASHLDFVVQAKLVLEHAAKHLPNARRVTFSFMARGEPLANPTILKFNTQLFIALGALAREQLKSNPIVNFSISTIMPNRVDLVKTFPLIHPRIYFSAYSPDDAIRASLIPNGIPFAEAAETIRDYSRVTGKVCFIHGTFIAGVNDRPSDAEKMAEAFEGAVVGANLVTYNPPDETTTSASPDVLDEIEAIYRAKLRGPVNAVPRIGFDVKASCGTFFTPETQEET